jgi:hypothetical protein
MTHLFRSMIKDVDGRPLVVETARGLGLRAGEIVVSPDGLVEPGAGGMSVSPDTPLNLPSYRRPPKYQGDGKDPVWELDTADLPTAVGYLPDPGPNPTHGVLEPAWSMSLEDFELALAETRDVWREC